MGLNRTPPVAITFPPETVTVEPPVARIAVPPLFSILPLIISSVPDGRRTNGYAFPSRFASQVNVLPVVILNVLVSTYCYTFVKTGFDIILQLFFISLPIISKHKIKLMNIKSS